MPSEDERAGHHLTNIIHHTMNVFVVVLLAMKPVDAFKEIAVANDQSPLLHERVMLIAAAATDLLFGLHAVHVESVA